MTEKIDFYIYYVHYNQERTHIVSVKRSAKGPSQFQELNRGQIVEDIEKKGLVYYSCYPEDKGSKNSKWFRGAKISIIEVNGHKYLRTNPNKESRDNLENVLEY